MGDVGQNSWEEINLFSPIYLKVVRIYGWNHYEGDSLYINKKQISNVVMPIYVYPNNANIIKVLLGWKEDSARGCSVTGGYVYRGDLIPELKEDIYLVTIALEEYGLLSMIIKIL